MHLKTSSKVNQLSNGSYIFFLNLNLNMPTFLRSLALVITSFFTLLTSAQAVCLTTFEQAYGYTDPACAPGMMCAAYIRPGSMIPLTKVARYYLTATGTHFYTTNPSEMGANWCTTTPAFAFEGYAFSSGIFNVSASNFAGGSPVYRFRNTQNGGYFYTIWDAERSIVTTNYPQFVFEGIAWYASINQIGNTKPVYRFSNSVNGGHFYTSNESERAYILQNLPQYAPEGIAFWAW